MRLRDGGTAPPLSCFEASFRDLRALGNLIYYFVCLGQNLAFSLQGEHQSVTQAHVYGQFRYVVSVIAFLIDFVGAAGLFEAYGVFSFVGGVDCDKIRVCVNHVVLCVVEVAACVLGQGGDQL